jgi:sugar O-acyltransferase (sialic acid O-acetyltransferase NeuD family)
MDKVIIFGLGEIAEIVHYYFSKDTKYKIVAFTVDKEYLKVDKFFDYPVVDFENIEEKYSPQEFKIFISTGYAKLNKLREKKYLEAKAKGYKFISYISPQANVADNAIIGENCFIFEDNTIQPFSIIEENCILWSGNHIGHHSIIRKNSFIASQVVISGGVEIGSNTFVGVNATIRDHIKIGKANVIGAGALILNDTEDYKVYMEAPTEPSKVPSNRLRGI